MKIITNVKLSIIDFINYLAVFIVFSDAITFQHFKGFADLRFSYIIIGLLFLILLWKRMLSKNKLINKTFLMLLIIAFLFSAYNIFSGKNNIVSLLKQIIGISLNASIFYILLEINNRDVVKLFKVYLNFAFIVAFIGIIQEICYLFGFQYGYDFRYILPNWQKYKVVGIGLLRLNSIINEPTDFCYVMMPAFFVSLMAFFRNAAGLIDKWKGIIIIVSCLLTFSIVGYIGIIFSVILICLNFKKKKNLIIGGIAVLVFALFFYAISREIRMKINQSIGLVTGSMPIHKANFSSYGLFTNAKVAWYSFKENPLLGSGLGSHEVSYDRFIPQVVDINIVNWRINTSDANSLFLRLLSETGLFGVLVLLIFIIKFYVSKKIDLGGYLWIISNAILPVFLMRLVRQGHYFSGGFFFFLWMYYFSKVNLKKNNRYNL